MARQNIEDEWWSDPRRGNLIVKLGCQFKADGAVLNAWKLAERYWKQGKGLIPLAAWQDGGMPDELFECRLAEMRDGFVYVRGIEDRMAWWVERQEAGRKGGLARASNAKVGLSLLEQTKQTQPSYSSSSSGSISNSISHSEKIEGEVSSASPPGISPDGIGLCESAWASTLKAFGQNRPILPHEQMKIAQLIRAYGAKPAAYALFGAQFEPKTDTFDPAKHVAISRLCDPEKFEKALNRGAAEQEKVKRVSEKEAIRAASRARGS